MGVQPPAPLTGDRLATIALVASLEVATVLQEQAREEPTRRYIGASGIGAECMAYHALCLRGFPGDTPSPQLLRIFDQGHRIEAMVVEALRSAGHKVKERDQSTGRQWGYSSHGGHHRAHLDGYIQLAGSTEFMLLEIKSMNRKSFESFEKKGVQLSHPQYYDQITDGLALAKAAGVGVNKGLIVSYCKDNSKYHAEIVEFDAMRGDKLFVKVAAVINGDARRQATYAKDFKCSMCSKRTSCWTPNVPNVECHHCAHAVPNVNVDGKTWDCKLHGKMATAVCPSFKLFRPEKA